MVDILIHNVRIVDGTGAPWFQGALAIENDTIADIYQQSKPSVTADIEIDGENLIACPGFIDTHSHSDLELFSDPTLKPKIQQGITTEILGQDGFSMAPMYRDPYAWETHISGINGRMDREWEWGGVAKYLDEIASKGVSPNIATLVGHSTVRYNVIGFENTSPSQENIDDMATLVRDSLEEGAIGFSTGLVYPPARYSDTGEVAALASQLKPYGRPFVSHIRNERSQLWEALDEFIDIGDDTEVPLHISHFKLAGPAQQGKVSRANSIVEAARERGIDLTAEQYPYTAGCTSLTNVLPPWVQAKGPEQTLEYLNDENSRERIRRDINEWRIDNWENRGDYTGWENIEVTNLQSDENKHLEGRSIAEIANKRETDPISIVCDLLYEEKLEVGMLLHQLAEEDVQELLANERINVATDGLFGAKPHPRVYGTYPRVLGRYVREKNILTLEEAIRKMTSLPARIMGLGSKGILRSGMDADIVLFDPNRISSNATYERPKQSPSGIRDVFVNGTPILRDSVITGARPGNVIRQ